MTTLFMTLLGMLLIACFILVIPFVSRDNRVFRQKLYGLLAFMMVMVGVLFYLSGGTHGLAFWLSQGKQHYELLLEVKQLGGIDGMIARVKTKLTKTPDDAEGWFMLGKLYLFKDDKGDATDAFTRAVKLQPSNPAYQKYLNDTSVETSTP